VLGGYTLAEASIVQKERNAAIRKFEKETKFKMIRKDFWLYILFHIITPIVI
jgi:hypothetical protein